MFDIDGVGDENLNNFFSGAMVGGAYPVPQHIVLSGHGVHLYYVLEEPIGLVPYLDSLNPEHPFTEADVDSALAAAREALARISTRTEERQYWRYRNE